MTIPALMQNSQRRELQAGLKKSYSTIAQALDMYYYDNGERINQAGSGQLKGVLLKYVKNIKDCGYGQRDGTKACINHSNYTSIYKNYSGKGEIYIHDFDDGQFVLGDGSLILIENVSTNIFISVDVNGWKKRPNRLGQDLFMFQLDKNGKLLPMGVSGSSFYSASDAYCSPTSAATRNGAGCTYKAMTDKDFFKNLPK